MFRGRIPRRRRRGLSRRVVDTTILNCRCSLSRSGRARPGRRRPHRSLPPLCTASHSPILTRTLFLSLRLVWFHCESQIRVIFGYQMKTSFPVDGIALDRDRFGQSAPATLCPVARPDRTARAAERPRIALDTGHGADLNVGRNTVIAACDQLGAGRLSRHTARRPRGDGPADPLSGAEHVFGRGRQSISRRGQTMLAQPYHHGRPACLPFIRHADPDNFRSIPGRNCSAVAQIRTYRSFRDLSRQRLSAALRGDSALSHASRGVKCTAEQIVVTNGAQSAFDLLPGCLIDDGDTVVDGGAGLLRRRVGLCLGRAKLAPLHVSNAGWNLDPPPVVPA